MKIIDKRKGKWLIEIENKHCPYIFYPRNDIACKLLENKIPTPKDTYCYAYNCIKVQVGSAEEDEEKAPN